MSYFTRRTLFATVTVFGGKVSGERVCEEVAIHHFDMAGAAEFYMEVIIQPLV